LKGPPALDEPEAKVIIGQNNMSFSITDRRPNGKGKSLDNRQKFLKRIRESIKKSLPDLINSRKIQDLDSDGGIIHIPQKGINEPQFQHGDGGIREVVRPGNKNFNPGDRFRKPPQGSGRGRGQQGSNEGEGEDDFAIEITRDEFLQYFFDDLELPDLVKEGLKQTTEIKHHNAGFTTSGSPAKLDERRSLRNSYSRRISQKAPYKKRLKAAEEELAQLITGLAICAVERSQEELDEIGARIKELEKKIAGYKAKMGNVPFLDPTDLRYHATVVEEKPILSAVMICIMDNSASMDEQMKTTARKFFGLLYMFLKRKYEKVQIRFIHHTTLAKELDEEEFFNTRETGGTVVSSALDLLKNMIETDYADGSTNVYVCQASDGDNYSSDNGTCYELLCDDILPNVQYYGYIQVGGSGEHSDIWPTYTNVSKEHKNFQMAIVQEDKDIYPVFRELFEKKK
jgi:uncharacterized sporulation protein YeaH/YhbH (DUF444 family)